MLRKHTTLQVQALPPQGCLLVTRLENQQYNPEINRLVQLLTEQGAQVFVVSVDASALTTDRTLESVILHSRSSTIV